MASHRLPPAEAMIETEFDMSRLPEKCEIYALYNVSDPERVRYVGQTRRSAAFRFQAHLRADRPSLPVSRWVLKHGRDAIGMRVLEPVDSIEALNEAEIHWIAHYRQLGQADLNLTSGGDGSGGKRIMTPEHRRNLSLATKGRSKSVGDDNPACKLNSTTVAELWARGLAEKISYNEEADRFSVSVDAIRNIFMGKSWNSVTGLPKHCPTPKKLLTDEQVRQAYRDFCDGMTLQEIADPLGVAIPALHRAFSGKSRAYLNLGGLPRTLSETLAAKAEKSDHLVMQAYERYKLGLTLKESVDGLGISVATLHKAIKGHSRKHLNLETVDFARSGNRKLTEAQAREIFAKVSSGALMVEVANEYGIDRHTVSSIVSGKTWKHLNLGGAKSGLTPAPFSRCANLVLDE